jgi:hypothetical protein
LEFHTLDGRGLGSLGKVAVEPPPTDRLAEGGRQDGVVSPNASGLQWPGPTFTGGELPIPLVEQSGTELGDRKVAELGED